jgi:hypothetical protein
MLLVTLAALALGAIPPLRPTVHAAYRYTEVRRLVTGSYVHGLPYDKARALGPLALPVLEKLLRDPSMKRDWTNVVTAIAYVGDPQGYRLLRDFLWNRFTGEVDNATWRALLAVPNVMGVIQDEAVSPGLGMFGIAPSHRGASQTQAAPILR